MWGDYRNWLAQLQEWGTGGLSPSWGPKKTTRIIHLEYKRLRTRRGHAPRQEKVMEWPWGKEGMLELSILSGCLTSTHFGEGRAIFLECEAFPEESLKTHTEVLFSSDWLSWRSGLWGDLSSWQGDPIFCIFFLLLEKASLHLYIIRKYFKPFDFWYELKGTNPIIGRIIKNIVFFTFKYI